MTRTEIVPTDADPAAQPSLDAAFAVVIVPLMTLVAALVLAFAPELPLAYLHGVTSLFVAAWTGLLDALTPVADFWVAVFRGVFG